jgi:N-acetylmuramoyl-L-alanine amidase
MKAVVISSGHGKNIRGAEGLIDEVDEARRVVSTVAGYMQDEGAEVIEYHDDISTTQTENLDRIVDFHNSQTRDLDVSVHFNAFEPTDGPRGTEVLYFSQNELAARVSNAIASASGLVDRGAKKHTELYFLNNTEEPAILIEVCFVDSGTDVNLYEARFAPICKAIANSIIIEKEEPYYPVSRWRGTVSWFGGPEDDGVAPDEGLAFIDEVEQAPHLFLRYQPEDTTGLARRLDPEQHYIAIRWDYDIYPKDMLGSSHYLALVRAPTTGRQFVAYPADWGPHEHTGRIADISPGLMDELGIDTDDEIEVIFPYKELPERET